MKFALIMTLEEPVGIHPMSKWDDYTIEVETGFVLAILLVIVFALMGAFLGG